MQASGFGHRRRGWFSHFAAFLMALLFGLSIALPASASQTKKKNEQYSATEDEGGEAPDTRPQLMPAAGASSDSQFAGPATTTAQAQNYGAPPTAVAPAPAMASVPATAPAPVMNEEAIEASEALVDSDSVPLPLPPPPYGAASAPAPRPSALAVPVIPPPPPPHGDAVPYDPVPASQKNAIHRRIQLVDLMIAKYGRAYDYRTHTLQELQNILAELDAAARQGRQLHGR